MGVLYTNTDYNINMDESDFNELKTRTFAQFGWPTVAIELNDDNFKYIIKRGIMYLNTYAPKLDYINKTVYPGQGEYTLFEYEQVNGVLDVHVSVEYLIGLGMPIQTALGVPMAFAAAQDTQQIINFVSIFSAYELSKRIFQTKPRVVLARPNIAKITPLPYMQTLFQFVIAVDHDTDLSTINDYELNWLERFCQANVGKVIGQIRRKYSGITLPVGSLDASGNSIYSESVQMEKELLDELKLRHKFPQTFISVG